MSLIDDRSFIGRLCDKAAKPTAVLPIVRRIGPQTIGQEFIYNANKSEAATYVDRGES
jgi:hypothetical protein